jgi:hypothetical protein
VVDVGASAWRREKEGEGACVAVGSVRRLIADPGRWAQAATLLCEQGRAAGHDRCSARATDRRGRAATGSDGQRQGAGESGAARRWGAQWQLAHFLNQFKNIQTVQVKCKFLQTLAGSKDTFPHSKKLK